MVHNSSLSVSKTFLHSGKDLDLHNGIVIRHPTIGEIADLNDGFMCDLLYWNYVGNILSDPYDNMVFLDDNGIDYETQSPFDVFVLKWQKADEIERKLMCDALSFFLGKRDYAVGMWQNGRYVIYDKNDTSYAFSTDIFSVMCDFVQKMNCICRDDKINPATKSAKRILIEDMRDEQKRRERRRKRKKDNTEFDFIGDNLSAVVYGGACGVSPLDAMNLHIFHVMHGGMVSQKKVRVGAMLNGVYTGMLKADKMSPKEFSWVSAN